MPVLIPPAEHFIKHFENDLVRAQCIRHECPLSIQAPQLLGPAKLFLRTILAGTQNVSTVKEVRMDFERI